MTFEPLDFFLLRTPRLPANTITQLNAHRLPQELAAYFHELFQAPDLQDAVYLASESLHQELIKFLETGPSTHTPRKLLLALYKYVTRMAARSTPFGLFAGVALGQTTSKPSRFILSGYTTPVLRMDMAFSAHLTRWTHTHTDIHKRAGYRINSSLIPFDDHYRYLVYQIEKGKRHYHWMRLTQNPLLDRVVSYTSQTRTYDDICTFLRHVGMTISQSENYIEQLAHNQFLVSDAEPVVTRSQTICLPPSLKAAREVIDNIPSEMKTDFVGASIQADLSIGTTENQCSLHTARILTDEIGQLLPLARRTVSAELTDFCRRFILRYDTQEVRLLEALDPDRGIGYGDTRAAYRFNNKLLCDIGLYKYRMGNTLHHENLHRIIRRHGGLDIGKSTAIELSAQDLGLLSSASPNEPVEIATTGYLMGQLIARDTHSLDQGDFLFNLRAAGGNSALPILARFCHLDPQLEAKLRQCASTEDHASPDVLFAEIVFLPDDRIGNIMLRPSLREYELSLVGHTATTGEKSIPVSDLWVSVENCRVVLRSEKLGKIIIPRLSCAHNYRLGTSVYRFLCDLQHQSHSLFFDWDWGEYRENDFLPRVTYKHIVLSRARWLISQPKEEAFFQLDPLAAVNELRTRHHLPCRVLLTEADNELLLDLTHFAAAEILIKYLKRSSVTLYENLAMENNSPVIGPNGNSFHNEIIIPFKTSGRITMRRGYPATSPISVQRTFPPGSEWVYLKLYIGPAESERLLMDEITRFIDQLKRQHLLKSWFFVRYADPEYHLRIRVLLRHADGLLPVQIFSACVNQCFGQAVSQGLIHRIQYDTYERELERYGGITIIPCEAIFQLDSEATLQLLPLFNIPENDRYRWLSAMIAIDDLLTAFGITPQCKLEWVAAWRENFLNEFNADKTLEIKLNQKFRENRTLMEGLFNTMRHTGPGVSLGRRFHALKSMNNDRWMTRQIAASLSHMFINRHFYTDQREMELVIYHFLTKIYRINLSRNVCVAHP